MKKLLLPIFSVIILAFLLAGIPLIKASAFTNQSIEQPDQAPALNASLQIRLYSEDGSYYDQGLGTLVEWQDERLVVTHNHWHFLQHMSKAELRDAGGSLLLELDAISFQRLIRYSDPGTLILQAPEKLIGTPVSLGEPAAFQVGDTLTIARQSPEDPSRTDLLSGRVKAVGTYKGKTVFYFTNTDHDKFIVQGDSGGGVWLDGQYAGNNWGMYVGQAGPFWNRQTVQTAIAAQFPPGFLQTLEAFQGQAGE